VVASAESATTPATAQSGMPSGAPSAGSASDTAVLERLRAGDEATFVDLVRRWSPSMLRLAKNFVGSTASAEDAVQDTWLAVLNGIDRFEGRSTLRTWTFTILVNRAKSRGVREHRTVVAPASGDDEDGPSVNPDRFRGPDGAYPGHWTSSGAPQPWHQPESRAVARETLSLVERALETLPERQRVVVTLRDVQGLSSEEVCQILQVSAGNQRLLLHRGRSTLRAVLEDYYRS